MKHIAKKSFSFGTKAETLSRLDGELDKCVIPQFFYFTVKEWQQDRENILKRIHSDFQDKAIIVRSSAVNEDSFDTAMAGEYLSMANIMHLMLKWFLLLLIKLLQVIGSSKIFHQ